LIAADVRFNLVTYCATFHRQAALTRLLSISSYRSEASRTGGTLSSVREHDPLSAPVPAFVRSILGSANAAATRRGPPGREASALKPLAVFRLSIRCRASVARFRRARAFEAIVLALVRRRLAIWSVAPPRFDLVLYLLKVRSRDGFDAESS